MLGKGVWYRAVPALALVLGLAGCAGVVPRSGPTKGEIVGSATQRNGNSHVVVVNQSVARAAEYAEPLGFPSAFRKAGRMEPDAIQPGDVLSMTIWENVSEGLLGVAGAPAPLAAIQVDDAGMIFVPYAGRLEAAGKTPDQLRDELTTVLAAKTPDPQVTVARAAGNGATVSVSGKIGQQGVYPIERPTRNLSAMLARAGGVTVETEIAQVTVLRGTQRGKIWFNQIYTAPSNDIALRAGDRILVEADDRYYTAIGATGRQTRVRFESQKLSAMEALAQVGGLSSNKADPTGIFLLRNEPEAIARKVLNQPSLTGTQQVAYIFNLTEGAGLFVARDFTVRDEDTIYITEAPISQFNKAISALFGSLGTVSSLQNLQ